MRNRGGVLSDVGTVNAGAMRSPPRFVPLWKRSDDVRREQLARLSSLELQAGDDFGFSAWEQARLLHQQLPKAVRVDLPSPRVFGRVLGLLRTCATIKRHKMLRLELSVADIASRLGYSKATVEAALRWLGCEPIEFAGVQVSRGLGLVHRGRRTGIAILDGVRRWVYRTSRIILTTLGRLLLGLPSRDAERKLEQKEERELTRREAAVVAAAQGPPEDDRHTPEIGRDWLTRIRSTLR